jgi:hypothetical protein
VRRLDTAFFLFRGEGDVSRALTTESQRTPSIAARHVYLLKKRGKRQNPYEFIDHLFLIALYLSSTPSCRAPVLGVLCESVVSSLETSPFPKERGVKPPHFKVPP